VSVLVLAPLARLPAGLLDRLEERLGEALRLPVHRADRPLDPKQAFDRDRRQFRSTELLDLLRDSEDAPTEGRILGVIDADLFVPVLTFVFGEADLDGRAAVMSLTRLRPSFYGLPEDPEVFLTRVVKEALHELGHTFGLRHCPRPDCVMRASTSADDVDLKPARFCPSCAAALG
jgi:archaemetzincin